MKSNSYTIYAYRSQEDASANYGSSYDTTEDTIKAAKERARYTLTEDFRQSGEMSSRLGYAQVRNDADEVVFDCFEK